MGDFELLTVSSIEKVMPANKPILLENENICFCNEVFAFQVAYCHHTQDLLLQRCTFKVKSDLQAYIIVRPVMLAPCTTPQSAVNDEWYMVKSATMVPDILSEEQEFFVRYNQWHSLWITVKGDLPVGKHLITISLFDGDGGLLGEAEYTLTVLKKALPKTTLKYAHWFHYDSLAEYYHVPVWSKEFNRIVYSFIDNAVKHGVNTLFLPLITTITNTKVGWGRTMVQLADIKKDKGKYSFSFDRVKEFMKTAEALGVENFEITHLFTQWGAKSSIKVLIEENGELKSHFGWDVAALDDSYITFIKELLSAFVKFLRTEGYGPDRCFFHISDEPNANTLAHYLQIRSQIKPILGEYKIFDALSNYEFSSSGAVDMPVVSTDKIAPFIENDVSDLWVYYCCGQSGSGLSNRFMSMPSWRTRVFGVQLYAVGCKGFLHWGYNYYNTALSEEYINPYQITDAWGSFQSGDSFIVYPSKAGTPLDSIRHEVLFEGFQDYSALLLLEEKIGRDGVLALLKKHGYEQNFTNYPKSAETLLALRKEIYLNVMSLN